MTLNFFKDLLFDEINESSIFPIWDITVNDEETSFTIEMTDGSVFVLKCIAE